MWKAHKAKANYFLSDVVIRPDDEPDRNIELRRIRSLPPTDATAAGRLMKDLEKATLPQWLNAPIIPKYSLRAQTSTRALNAPWYAKLLTPKND